MRNRIIKEGFFRNYELALLPPLARILFQGLWCMADKEGRLWDRPPQIKAECLPYDECDADGFLQLLHEAKFILRYEAQDRKCIQIINFAKHQALTSWESAKTESFIPSSEVLQKYNTRTAKRIVREENRREEEEKREEKVASASPALPDWLDKTLWRRWLKHRKEIKHPVTDQQAEAQIRVLEKFRARGHPPETVIENSIVGGWQGLFEPKESSNGKPSNDSKQESPNLRRHRENYERFGKPGADPPVVSDPDAIPGSPPIHSAERR